jgi:Holliday junction resolvase RusA-like endonuclease
MKKTELFFPFEPKPKGRPRMTRRGRAYTPKRTHDYEKLISDYYKGNTTDYYDSAIKVSLIFYMPIPKSMSQKKRALMESGEIKCTAHTGDADNLAKAVTDALNGVAYEDDCLITDLHIKKRYGSFVGTEMTISEDVE